MKYFRIIYSSFIFCLALSGLSFAQDLTRAVATWQVQKYDITATLPQSDTDRNLAVKAVLSVKNISYAAATTLTLRISPNAEISAVNVNGSVADFSKREEKINASSSLQRIIIRIPAVQAGGLVSAAVDYKLNIKDNTGISSLSPVGSHFLPLSFWYPTPNSWYFARGADYALFRIQVNSPSGLTVLSSGAESSGSFDQKLIGQPFFAAGNWDPVNANGVTVYVPKGVVTDQQGRPAEIAALASDARAYISSFFGNSVDSPLRIAAVKRGSGFSGGGTIFVDEGVFRRQMIDSQTAMNVAESVAKIWLGNAVGISGDGQGVLREGLARYLATQFLESKFGKDIADIERMRQRNAYAAVSNRDSPLSTVSPLDDYYFPEVANKGAMIWRLLAKRVGGDEFANAFRSNIKDGQLDLAKVRNSFSAQKELLDYMFDTVTDMNLLAGLPQTTGSETKVALRNTGGVDATVNIVATTANGEKISAPTTVRAKSFGEVSFRTPNKIVRVEIDSDKMYPQVDYSDDVAPRETTDSDLLLAVKRNFDKQDFANAEKLARSFLRDYPRFDDVRVLLARSLLAKGNTADADKEFRAVLDEKLPTARSLAWANVGLAETSLKAGQNSQAVKFAEEAIRADAEYGASLAARSVRTRANATTALDNSVKSYFAQFDKSAVANRKAELDAMVVPGDATKFASGISGQTEQWQTQVKQIDKIDANSIWVETNLNIKLLNKDPESGMAVYRLAKVGGNWKLSAVDMFEVR